MAPRQAKTVRCPVQNAAAKGFTRMESATPKQVKFNVTYAETAATAFQTQTDKKQPDSTVQTALNMPREFIRSF